jgi:hypothetical protein
MKLIMLAFLGILMYATTAQAANCRWTYNGYVCAPGWMWQDGREWSEYEWREQHRHHEREREGDWSRHYHYDERH